MTTTDPTTRRRRVRRTQPTPESRRLAELETKLADPKARDELRALTATTVLAA